MQDKKTKFTRHKLSTDNPKKKLNTLFLQFKIKIIHIGFRGA